ncbi:hypothetical protein GCM10017673_56210 [Streptosporangium violaceochromogenes]|nr:hypothetical protein GCM10017673_56210 [Streptosporangium violaceochromogenes]
MTIGITKKRVATLLAAGAVAATLIGVTPAHADSLCTVTENTWVRSSPWGSVLYTIPKGGSFRAYWWTSSGWAYGHGRGRADGYAPGWQLKNCH